MQTTTDKDLAQRELDAMCVNESQLQHQWYHNLKYVFIGALLGLIFVKGEIISWFRIQEMFHFQSFHMFGVIGSAIVVASVSIFIIKKFKLKTIYGESIKIADKEFNKGQIYGGLIFGLGWGLSGACPGPLFAHVGAGTGVIMIVIAFAVLGTWIYGKFRDQLPH